MARIALIDTNVDTAFLSNTSVEKIKLCPESSVADSHRINHGTACAIVLDRCACDFELLNIQVFKGNGRKVFTEVGLLVKALECCLDNNVDIISLSAVSSLLSDSRYLYSVTHELAKRSIIISALDNNLFVTVPTSYPHVLGVRCDFAGLLSPGEIAYCAGDPYYADVFANCNFDYLQEYQIKPSNSYAVPVVAAYVNVLLNKGHNKKSPKSMIQNLRPYNAAEVQNAPNKYVSQGRDVPAVLLTAYSNEMCCAMMDDLFANHEVQSATLSMEAGYYDVRIREQTNPENIQGDLLFMERHYKADVIFILCNQSLAGDFAKRIEVDVEIMYHGNGQSSIRYECMQETVPLHMVPDRLHDILAT